MPEFNLEQAVLKLLSPKQTLDQSLFDEHDAMKESVRLDLLKISDKVIEKTIGKINGLEVTDICLTGSASNYFYHEKSDIDLRIEVHNKHAKELAKDAYHFDKFLSTQIPALLAKGYKFIYQNRLVDIKMSSKQIDFVSLYSIKHNKWLIYPDQKVIEKITAADLISYYKKRKTEILSGVHTLKTKYKGADLGDKLEEFYVQNVNKSIVGSPTLEDYLVFKLLNKEGILKPIGSDSILAYNKAFSMLC